jgi:glycosyltransferase involved in cell wall biosynthesis
LPGPLERPVSVALAAARLRPADLRHPAPAIRRQMRSVAMVPEMAALQQLRARADLRRAGALDGAVQHGCEYRVPWKVPFVTFEDSTFLQAVRAYDWPWLRPKSARAVRGLAERQRAIYERATACCAMSHWAARSMVEDYGVPRHKVAVVGLGRNSDPEAPPRDWAQPRFLFVGKDWERKNGPRVLAAFAALEQERPEARLDIVGGHPPIDRPGVVGHGLLDLGELARLYAAATCFVLPSLHEPAGTVYAEAAAAGLPSIGSTAGGGATVIDGAGRVVAPDDDAGLLDAMRELAHPEVAARLGEQALLRSDLFTWRAVAERMVRALAPAGVEVDGLAEFL